MHSPAQSFSFARNNKPYFYAIFVCSYARISCLVYDKIEETMLY